MFCRNCGKDLVGTPEICASCGSPPVKASAFCRYCGGATIAQEVMCPQCGAATRTFAKSGEVSNKEGRGRFTTTRTIVKILAAVTFVSIYTVLALPPRTALRPIQSAASDLVLASTGYTALPLTSLSVYPIIVPPEVGTDGGPFTPIRVFTINSTQQLIIFANYMDTSSNSLASGGRSEDVTDKAIYKSNNDGIATVSSSGLVEGVSPGIAVITIKYTAAPGSTNRTSSVEGKAPITVACQVPVKVVPVPVTVRTAHAP